MNEGRSNVLYTEHKHLFCGLDRVITNDTHKPSATIYKHIFSMMLFCAAEHKCHHVLWVLCIWNASITSSLRVRTRDNFGYYGVLSFGTSVAVLQTLIRINSPVGSTSSVMFWLELRCLEIWNLTSIKIKIDVIWYRQKMSHKDTHIRILY